MSKFIDDKIKSLKKLRKQFVKELNDEIEIPAELRSFINEGVDGPKMAANAANIKADNEEKKELRGRIQDIDNEIAKLQSMRSNPTKIIKQKLQNYLENDDISTAMPSQTQIINLSRKGKKLFNENDLKHNSYKELIDFELKSLKENRFKADKLEKPYLLLGAIENEIKLSQESESKQEKKIKIPTQNETAEKKWGDKRMMEKKPSVANIKISIARGTELQSQGVFSPRAQAPVSPRSPVSSPRSEETISSGREQQKSDRIKSEEGSSEKIENALTPRNRNRNRK